MNFVDSISIRDLDPEGTLNNAYFLFCRFSLTKFMSSCTEDDFSYINHFTYITFLTI